MNVATFFLLLFSEARVWFLLLLLLWARPVYATDNHLYKAGEYATISGGRSPDGRWAVAAHGDGPAGYDNFDLYFMRKPANTILAPLRINGLDTGPISIAALWAADSKCVAVLYRTDRHVLDLGLFTVANGRLRSIKVPLLIHLIGQQYLKPGVHYEFFSRLYRVSWQKLDRIVLEELDTLDAHQPVYKNGMGAYLTLDRMGPERAFTEFSAQAVCEITEKGKLRILTVKPLPLPEWPRTITYSPHLLYDPENGLHDTETSLSSLGTAKDPQ